MGKHKLPGIRTESREVARSFPAPTVVEHVLICPMLPRATRSKGVLHVFEADVSGADLRSLRQVKGALRSVTDVRPVSTSHADAEIVPGATIYAGPWFNHFGHFVAEGIHRLWAAALPGMEDARVLFQVGSGAPAVPSWAGALLATFGVAADRVLFTTAPRFYEKLVVARPGRVFRGPLLIENYLDLFPLQDHGVAPGDGRPIYLSRSRQTQTGGYFGERLIEKTLRKAHFDIVRPEDRTLAAVIRKIIKAPLIVAAEGSAIHNIELCGPLAAKVFVIGRRAGSQEFKWVLAPATPDWTILDPGEPPPVFNLDWDAKTGKPVPSGGNTFVDIPRLLSELSSFSGISFDIPDREEVRDAVSADLAAYLMHPNVGRRSTTEQIGRSLQQLRTIRGLRDLFVG